MLLQAELDLGSTTMTVGLVFYIKIHFCIPKVDMPLLYPNLDISYYETFPK